MSLYTTPLQIGYFLALVMSMMFWYRGWKEERLSDKMLGWVMLFLALQLQDYTFGFSGINFLWEEMNGFPRGISLLFGPAIYFYLRAQVNREFRFSRHHLIHLLPWSLFFVTDIFFFVQGKYVVQWWQGTFAYSIRTFLENTVTLASFSYYFYLSLKLYRRYRHWALQQFSDQHIVSLSWFRNFIYLMIAGIAFKLSMFGLDALFNWDFYQDWWWNLGLVVIVFYTGIQGYAQAQPGKLSFDLARRSVDADKVIGSEMALWKAKIEASMEDQKHYLNPQLTLRELAAALHTNSSTLSAAINQNFDKNFNDFVNGYRIRAFLQQLEKPQNSDYTLLAIALDCGFNSKATFNRAFRKQMGISPNDYRRQNR
ncbi:MAG: helix-turn-helix domain-containing protein [Saprospiraceae bacterium]